MKVFGIAESETECFGHGDYAKVTKICPVGPYGTGEFPPVFSSREVADAWLKMNDKFGRCIIVEMEFIQ